MFSCIHAFVHVFCIYVVMLSCINACSHVCIYVFAAKGLTCYLQRAALNFSSLLGQWLYRVADLDGIQIRSAPNPHSLPCGSREKGEYVRVVQQQGRWLKLAPEESESKRNPLRGE